MVCKGKINIENLDLLQYLVQKQECIVRVIEYLNNGDLIVLLK